MQPCAGRAPEGARNPNGTPNALWNNEMLAEVHAPRPAPHDGAQRNNLIPAYTGFVPQTVALRDVPLLRFAPEAVQKRLEAAARQRVVHRTELLFSEGQKADSVYALQSGRIKLVRYTPRGKELLLHLVGPGETFAEAAVFGEGTYPATAVAVERSVVSIWPRSVLLELVRSEPEVAMGMIASISRWTRLLASKLVLLTQRRVEERLALFLIARSGQRKLRPGDSVELPEARHLVAAQCGTAPEVLSRTFRRFEEEGLIRAEGHTIVILDPVRLASLAAGTELGHES